MIGKTLAHYEILEPLGAGGMGEVYRARDTQLDRDVAIKVLPEDFATDADRLARFEREAKLLASLNHANIATIHGLEDSDGVRFIAMELVEGETLAERIASSGRIEVEEALEIARQIAEALETAHDNGVIHRDLKPANVIVTVDGKAKVLDFGLAKAYEAAGTTSDVAPDLSHSPTMVGATRTGVILGTAAYMSPEQARGRPVDKRTDIWAFGCVLFEMLAGQAAFGGESVSDTMAAILKEEPDWSGLPDSTPSASNVLRCCLEKNPRDRIRDMGDVRLAMAGKFDLAPKGASEIGDVALAPWQTAPVAAATLVAAAAVASLLTWIAIGSGQGGEQQTRELPRLLRDVSLELPETAPLVFVGEAAGAVGQTALTISPDGRNIAYVGPAEGATPDEETTRLYVRAVDGFDEARPLADTEGAYAPFFSQSGQWIGFFAGQELKRVSLEGDQVVTIAEANWSYGGSWNEADRIAVVTNDGREVGVVAFGESELEFVDVEERDFIKFTQPSWLPGDDWLLLTCSPAHLCAVSTRTGEWRHLVPDGASMRTTAEGQLLEGTSPRYVDSGHIVYNAPDTNAVRAIRFDPETLTTSGQPEVVLQGVRRETSFGALQLAISKRGDLVYAPGGDEMEGAFAWVAEGGALEELPFARRPYGTFHLSPNGRRIAAKVVPAVGPSELWFLDLDDPPRETRWRDDGVVGDGEVWPGPWIDSARIVANALSPSANGGTRRVFFEVDANDAIGGEVKGEIEGAWIDDLGSDDSLLIQIDFANADASHYRLIPRAELNRLSDGTAEGRPLLTGRRPALGSLSPAVDWITYTTDLRGPFEVWGARLDSEGQPVRISDGPGWLPLWHPQGDGLYYRSGERFYWVPYTPSSERPFGQPRFFLQGTFLQAPGQEYAVSPDGDRLLVLVGSGERTQSTLRLLTNWRGELERRLPPRSPNRDERR